MKKKRSLVLVLAFCMLLCACSGKVAEKDKIVVTTSLENKPVLVGNIPCEFPLVDKDTGMDVVISGYGSEQVDDVYVLKKYEEMTGVDVNWIGVAAGERDEIINSMLINQNQIDLILRCKVNSTLLTQYAENGYILNLMENDLLQTYAPNCWAYLQSHPDSLASIMTPDGAVYALPQINSGPELRVSRKIYINNKWLEHLNLDVPTTTEEFYQMLKAFQEEDANQNGDPNDEIPLCPRDWGSVLDSLYGAFGLANRGVHNLNVDFDEDTGTLRLIAASPEYKAFLEYIKLLYTEKLLDNRVFTIKKEQWATQAANDQIGVYMHTNLGSLPAAMVDNWIAVEDALIGPFGDQLWSAIRANFHSTGAAVIPSTCKDPGLVLRWLDYFWTDEGTLFYHMGIEGETFETKEDGSYDYLPEIYERMKNENLSFDNIISTYSPYPGGSNPLVEIAPYFMGGEMAAVPANAARKLFEYGPEEYWPSFTFTVDENERLSILEADINKYCSSSQIAFITGEKSFDEWDKYLTQIDNLGKAEYLGIYRAAYDRYQELLPNGFLQ